MKILRYSIYTVILLAIVLIAYAYFTTTNSKSGLLVLPGLTGEVTITRDQYGITHIRASKSDADAFYALGYAHAQDRFWQMEFQRRVAQGTLSEVFGSRSLQYDKLLRTFGFYRAAKTVWPALDARSQQIIRHYTQGVNAFLQRGKLPLQFKLLRYKPKPWTEIDTLSWQKIMAFDLQKIWLDKLHNYLIAQKLGKENIALLNPPYPKGSPTVLNNKDLVQSGLLGANEKKQVSNVANIFQFTDSGRQITAEREKILSFSLPLWEGDDRGKGSNNWVVSGLLTATGKPMLANDPHLALFAPALWYLVELQGPEIHVTGATLPGLPVVVLGHNDKIAWGATNVSPDTQDLYIEAEKTPLSTIEEIIKVRGQPDVKWPVQYSAHGPIISAVSDVGKISPRVAIKWTALQPGDTTVQSMIAINYAKNWQEFKQALKSYIVPSQNFAYADVEGNIGYYMPGRIPLRKEWDGRLPVTPDQDYEWAGYIPFDQLPHVYNPSAGFIASANNKVVTDHYRYPLTFRWKVPPYRIERLLEMLSARQPLALQDSQAMQLDTLSLLWLDLRPLLLAAKPLNADSQSLLDVLKAWDGYMTLDSQGALAFAFWYRELTHLPVTKLPFIKEWMEPLFIKQQLSDNGIFCRSETTVNCAAYLSQSLQKAARKLTKKYGRRVDHWRWEKSHRMKFIELGIGFNPWIGWIWNRSVATPGGEETLNVGAYQGLEGTPAKAHEESYFYQWKGASYRQIIDLGNLNNSVYMIPMGQVDNPFDAHYSHFMKMWRDGDYVQISSDHKTWGKSKTQILQPG